MCVSPQSTWVPVVDGGIFPFQDQAMLKQIQNWNLPRLFAGKYVLLLEKHREGGPAHAAEARSFAEEHGLDYQYEGEVDPFRHVVQALQARKVATTSRFSVG